VPGLMIPQAQAASVDGRVQVSVAAALVHINTLQLQAVLTVPEFHDRIGGDEHRALNALFWSHISPYRRFRLNMDTHRDLSGTSGTGIAGAEAAL
jgi:hypothetical protein